MYSRKANLDSHISHVHTTERKFECEICGMKLKTKGILRNHKKIHSTNPDDFYNCDMCQRQFKTRNQLINHKVSRLELGLWLQRQGGAGLLRVARIFVVQLQRLAPVPCLSLDGINKILIILGLPHV